MNKYWVGQLSLEGLSPKTALYDETCQAVGSAMVKLYISELNRYVHYNKNVVRPKLRKLSMDDSSARSALNRYEAFKQKPLTNDEDDHELDKVNSYRYGDDSALELLNELYDDACDYARSEEEGWFYSDTDSDSESGFE